MTYHLPLDKFCPRRGRQLRRCCHALSIRHSDDAARRAGAIGRVFIEPPRSAEHHALADGGFDGRLFVMSYENAGALTQVSRLGMPLVNEVVVGLPDKDRYSASEPKDDGQS
jgi:hypothetical protein